MVTFFARDTDYIAKLNELAAGGPGGGASVTVGTTPPGTPAAGDMWWKADEGRLKVYYDDGSSSQWVDAFALPEVGDVMTNPMTTVGDLIVGGTAGAETRLPAGSTSGHVLTSNGASTAPSWQAAGGGGISSGTANPGSPSAGDLFFRTDLGLLIYYDGTRWLTVNEYSLRGLHEGGTNGTTANNNYFISLPIDQSQGGSWATRFVVSTYVSTTNNGSNYWTVLPQSADSADINFIALGSGFTTAADTVTTRALHPFAVGAAVNSAHKKIWVGANKFGSPGTLTLDASFYYRLIVT